MGSIGVLSYDPDGETVGNAPSGWTRGGNAAATVQNAPSGMSGQAIRITQVSLVGDTIQRSYTKQSSGTHYVSFQARIGATTNRRYGDVMIYDGANRAARLLFTSITVGSDNNAVRASNGGTYFTVVGLSTSTTYNVVMALDCTNKKWSVRIDGTLYDNSGSMWSFDSASAAAGDSILVDSYSPEGATSGEYTWFDKLYIYAPTRTVPAVSSQAVTRAATR